MSAPATCWEDVYRTQTARITELERENAALREDKARLDWLSCHPGIIKHYDENWYWAGEEIATLRGAIDAIMGEGEL